MTTTSDLARALDEERKRQGLTFTDIINRAGVSRAAVYRLFNGGDVQLTTLLAVTNMLGLDLVAMRTMLAQLMPDATRARTDNPINEPLQIQRSLNKARITAEDLQRQRPALRGPMSAVAARAAQLQSNLKTRKS